MTSGISSNLLPTQSATTAAAGATSNTGSTAAQSTLSSAVSSTAADQSQFSGNMNTFLQLLTTQLQYQDPLDPMDTSQFTNQLVEFASVQQQIDINTNLESMLANQDNSAMATAANYIGQQATGISNSLPLQSSTAQFAYTTPANTGSVNIVISDSSGNIVATMTGNATAGTNVQSWNGQNIYGEQEPDGTYQITVNALGSDGTNTQLQTAVTGKVTGVGTDPSNNQTELFMGGAALDLSNVVEVQAAGSTVDTGTLGNALSAAATAASNASNSNTGSTTNSTGSGT